MANTNTAGIFSLADALAAYDADPVPDPTIELHDLPQVICMNQVEPMPIHWLWDGWLPKGMLTILGGFAGDGKSTITMALAAAFSNGGALPDGSPAPVVNTLLALSEDDLHHVVAPRLAAHGADRSRIIAFTGKGSDGRSSYSLNLRSDIPKLAQIIRNKNIGLMIIDPVSSFLSSSDRNNEGEIRDVLGPLTQMAEETGVAIIGVMHIGKSDGYQRSMQRLMGSTAFTALARSVWMVAPLPDDQQETGEPLRKVLGVTKSNYAIPPRSLEFSRPLDAAMVFHGESAMSVDDALNWRKGAGQEKGSEERDNAKDFLYKYLAGGMKPVVEIERVAGEEGHTKRILRRAKDDMAIRSVKVKNSWCWMLPSE